MRKTMREHFGIASLRDGQKDIIRSVIAGRDTLAVMPTGAGKSLCYQLPALHLPGLTLVVSPLIALMKDQADKLAANHVQSVLVNSTVTRTEERKALASIAGGEVRIVFVTPERLASPAFIDLLRQPDTPRLSLAVVDEAHCISQWGHDFRPAFLDIPVALDAVGRPPLLALTATATREVADDIVQSLRMREPNVVRTGIYRPNLQYRVVQTSAAGPQASSRATERKRAQLLTTLEAFEGAGIVYTATVAEAERIRDWLAERHGSEAVSRYHGKLTARVREAEQERFMSGEARIMVATNAFGMGIDRPDIRFIVHYQMPGSLDAYYQETGRAGRDGEAAHCVLLFDLNDRRIHQFFMAGRYPDAALAQRVCDTLAASRESSPGGLTLAQLREALPEAGAKVGSNKLDVCVKMLTEQRVLMRDRRRRIRLPDTAPARKAIEDAVQRFEEMSRRDKRVLERMIDYAQSGRCRWRLILEHFDDSGEVERCGHCDNCLHPPTAHALPPAQRASLPNAARRRREAAQRGWQVGERVRVARYGHGEVVLATGDQVVILFPNGTTRTFLAGYVKRA